MTYSSLTSEQQLTILNQVNALTGQEPQNIEKDWWVTQVLRVLFSLPYAKYMSFKGGTSLSKAWNLINRFSEDIDIAVSREYLGFAGELSRTQVSDKLRRAACTFVRETLQNDVRNGLLTLGIGADKFTVRVNITSVTTVDPEVIYVDYQSGLPQSEYIAHTVKIEVSGRSMHDSVDSVALRSLIDQYLPQTKIVMSSFDANVVIPKRTFIEKVMLLHEEFAKPIAEVRTERMSRHLYDLERMMRTDIMDKALTDEQLYRAVLEHRRKFMGLKGFDYDTLYPKTLSLHIPTKILPLWKQDYEAMQKTMIYGDSLPFNELLARINELNTRINALPFAK
ncbi:MAG: nucleotidyl transferase AbiEii/AbiGii toxin family protein [Paludibacteraceae bacterium]|nr:nucleotidyl transferase AbiEii/AbiGii toxin family protein [Paludibacteraceae bacterium]